MRIADWTRFPQGTVAIVRPVSRSSCSSGIQRSPWHRAQGLRRGVLAAFNPSEHDRPDDSGGLGNVREEFGERIVRAGPFPTR